MLISLMSENQKPIYCRAQLTGCETAYTSWTVCKIEFIKKCCTAEVSLKGSVIGDDELTSAKNISNGCGTDAQSMLSITMLERR